MMQATGWAVVEGDKINVRSIQDSRIGAIVNFLLTERDTMIWDQTTDDDIEGQWQRLRGAAQVAQIEIRVKEDAKTDALAVD